LLHLVATQAGRPLRRTQRGYHLPRVERRWSTLLDQLEGAVCEAMGHSRTRVREGCTRARAGATMGLPMAELPIESRATASTAATASRAEIDATECGGGGCSACIDGHRRIRDRIASSARRWCRPPCRRSPLRIVELASRSPPRCFCFGLRSGCLIRVLEEQLSSATAAVSVGASLAVGLEAGRVADDLQRAQSARDTRARVLLADALDWTEICLLGIADRCHSQ
jgi:hypothetical protein